MKKFICNINNHKSASDQQHDDLFTGSVCSLSSTTLTAERLFDVVAPDPFVLVVLDCSNFCTISRLDLKELNAEFQ